MRREKIIHQILLTLSFLNAARAGDLTGKVQFNKFSKNRRIGMIPRNKIESLKVTVRNDFIIPCPIDQLPCSGND